MPTESERWRRARVYVKSLRHVDKGQYADSYFNYLIGRCDKPKRDDLSVMDAQLVRMTINDIMGID